MKNAHSISTTSKVNVKKENIEMKTALNIPVKKILVISAGEIFFSMEFVEKEYINVRNTP